jgi:hypothetical protein
MHQPERNFRELVKLTVGLAAVSVAAMALYFALYLLVYFTILRTGGAPQKLATGQLGTLLLLYCPAFLSSAIASWVMLRGAKPNVSGIVHRLIAVLSTVLVVAGALFLLPGSYWAWINLVLATICFFLGSLTIGVIYNSSD